MAKAGETLRFVTSAATVSVRIREIRGLIVFLKDLLLLPR